MIEGTSITGHYLPKPSSYRPMASMKVQSGGRDVKHRILRLALQVHAHAHVHVHVHVRCTAIMGRGHVRGGVAAAVPGEPHWLSLAEPHISQDWFLSVTRTS